MQYALFGRIRRIGGKPEEIFRSPEKIKKFLMFVLFIAIAFFA
jgi:hypothetical protein